MVVFIAITLVGLFPAFFYQTDLLFTILGIGIMGFIVSAFFAVDKKIDEPHSLERVIREREGLRTLRQRNRFVWRSYRRRFPYCIRLRSVMGSDSGREMDVDTFIRIPRTTHVRRGVARDAVHNF